METNGHYFDQEPISTQLEGAVQLSLPDFSATFVTASNVFSWKKLDTGTKFLLLNVPKPEASPKNVLDLGCGYGPIAAVMEHRFPGAKVWGIDVNRRAIELAKSNTRSEETVICAPDEVPEDITFDLIWSNPPIRIGKENLKMVLTRWLGRLHLSGVAYLVINKNLGADSVQKWLENESWETSRLKSLKGYRLLEVKHHV